MGLLTVLATYLLVGSGFGTTPPLAPQGDAKSLRMAALSCRTQADEARHTALNDRIEADAQRGKATELRGQAADARAKGDPAQADALEQQAKQSENAAKQNLDAADALDKQAASLEAQALTKEAEARKLEGESAALSDKVYRRARTTLAKARADLDDLKLYEAAARVGKRVMYTRLMIGNDHDFDLKPFGQAELSALFQPYEAEIDQTSASVEQIRDSLAAGKTSDEIFCAATYQLMHDFIPELEDAEFSIVSSGYNTYEADIYLAEQKFRNETNEELGEISKSSLPYALRQAAVDIAKNRHDPERKVVFFDIAKRYRAERARLALFRQEWIDEITAWHDFASALSKGSDVHAAGAALIAGLIGTYFTADGVALPQSVGRFAFVPGSPDRYSTPYDDFDWCKAMPFPDIQQAGAPGQLRMTSIVDKLPVLVDDRKYDGAAKGIGP